MRRRQQAEPQKQELSRRARRRSERGIISAVSTSNRRGEESGRKKRARDQRMAGGREDLDGGRSPCLLLNSAAPLPDGAAAAIPIRVVNGLIVLGETERAACCVPIYISVPM